MERIKEPEPGVRLVCRGRPATGNAAPVEAAASDAVARALEWLRTMQDGPAFRFSAQSPSTLIATALAVLILEGTGELGGVPEAQRRAWAEWLQGCQDPATGIFVDPLLDSVPLDEAEHDRQYFDHMCTYFAVQALDALHERPAHRLRFLDAFTAKTAVRWLKKLDWSNPWLESNRVMFVLTGLIYRAEVEEDGDAPAAYHSILDWLDRAQDPRTGFWWNPDKTTPLNAMAGAFHFLPFYHYVHRPVTHLSKLAAACLRLQCDDGLFAPRPGGGACEDMDALCILATLASEPDSHPAEYKRALIRAFWAIWNLQGPDGAFPYAGRQTGETYRFGSWGAMEARVGGGDVFSVWFRLASLAMIARLYPDDVPRLGPWQFRRWPALGYFPGFGERRSGPGSLWMRPLRERRSKGAQDVPRVSVVIPCHNLGEYLYEAIQSVLDQEEAAEVIVVDDGSTDEFTTWYAQNVRAAGLRGIRTDFRNVAAARNAAIEQACGEYICCLDADDRLRSGFLRRTVRMLDENPAAGFVSCHYETFDEEAATYRMNACRLPDMLARNEAVGVSLFRKEAWRKAGGYSAALSGMHDWDLWIGILEAGYEGAVVPEVLFEYRKRRGSMYTVTSRQENYVRLASEILARHRSTYEKWFEDVLRLKTLHFVELLGVRNQESRVHAASTSALEQNAAYMRRAADEAQAWVRQLEEARDWWKGNAAEWQASAERATEGRTRLARGIWKIDAALERSLAAAGRLGRSVLLLAGLRNLRSKIKNVVLWHKLTRDATASGIWRGNFRPAWYLENNPDVGSAGVSPLLHFLIRGFREGRDPSPGFSSMAYLRAHTDVAEAGINPLLHYALFGRSEARTPRR